MKKVTVKRILTAVRLAMLALLLMVGTLLLFSFSKSAQTKKAKKAIMPAEAEMNEWMAKVEASRDQLYGRESQLISTTEVIVLK